VIPNCFASEAKGSGEISKGCCIEPIQIHYGPHPLKSKQRQRPVAPTSGSGQCGTKRKQVNQPMTEANTAQRDAITPV
jgi:hypothetical protein